MKHHIVLAMLTIASSTLLEHQAHAGAYQWRGGSTVTFNPNSQACTGLVANQGGGSSNNPYVSGANLSTNGFSYETGFAAYSRSTAGGGGFLFTFDEPVIRWNVAGGPFTTLYDVNNRKFSAALLSGGSAQLLFPGVAITGSSTWSSNLSFSGTDLVGNVSINYTASGTSCQLNAAIMGLDAGGSIN